MNYILLVIGFILLVKGADYFVDGSSSIAKKLRIPSLIIGLTIVAFGTSAPEAAVSITASVNGQNGMGNFMNALVIFIGILIPLLLFFDILLNKDRTAGRKDKKTDWFYTNKDYDREFDERADRNQYRT